MATTDKFHASIGAWESGALGRDEKYVRRTDPGIEKEFDDASEMQMISIRFQKRLIEDLKAIAGHNGLGYQPLIRQVLTRFVISEIKMMMKDAIAEARFKQLPAKTRAAANPRGPGRRISHEATHKAQRVKKSA